MTNLTSITITPAALQVIAEVLWTAHSRLSDGPYDSLQDIAEMCKGELPLTPEAVEISFSNLRHAKWCGWH